MLLDLGADTEAKDGSGRTAAEWAAIGARRELMSMLPGSEPAEVLSTSATGPDSPEGHSRRRHEEYRLTWGDRTAVLSQDRVHLLPQRFDSDDGAHRSKAPRVSGKRSSMQQMVKETIASLGPHRENLLSGYCSVPGMPTTSSYAAISLQVRDTCRTRSRMGWSDAWLSISARMDIGPRVAPAAAESDSSVPGTALSARTLRLYPVPAIARQLDAAVDRARVYLLSARPWFGDDYEYRVLGLFWTDAEGRAVDAAARELIAQQRPDGGWGQTPDMSSDAYATGLALSALAMAAPAAIASDAYRRGVEYLMRTQKAMDRGTFGRGHSVSSRISRAAFRTGMINGFPWRPRGGLQSR